MKFIKVQEKIYTIKDFFAASYVIVFNIFNLSK